MSYDEVPEVDKDLVTKAIACALELKAFVLERITLDIT